DIDTDGLQGVDLQPSPRLLQTFRVQADGLDQRAPRLRGRQQEVLRADHVIAPRGTDLFRGTENDRPGLGRELLEHLSLPCILCAACRVTPSASLICCQVLLGRRATVRDCFSGASVSFRNAMTASKPEAGSSSAAVTGGANSLIMSP